MDENGDPVTIPLEEQEQEEPESSTGNQPEVPDPKPKPDEEEQEEEQEIVNDPVEPEEQEEEEEKPVSRRESKRIEKLLDKLNQYQQGGQPRRTAANRPAAPVIKEGDYNVDELNNMAQEYGQKLYQQGLSEAQAYNIANTFATRLEIDAPKVGSKYQFLDTESDQFNPGPTDFINRMYLSMVGYDPQTGVVQNTDLRYGEFVEGFMDVVELLATEKVAGSTKNVAKQAAQTGLRPGGSKKSTYQGDDPRQMTDEQLEAAISSGLGIRK